MGGLERPVAYINGSTVMQPTIVLPAPLDSSKLGKESRREPVTLKPSFAPHLTLTRTWIINH